jgi:hypothetical protein
MAGPDFPTKEEVEKASSEQLAYWFRFSLASTAEEQKTLARVVQRLRKSGGIAESGDLIPELSEKVGFGGVQETSPSRKR